MVCLRKSLFVTVVIFILLVIVIIFAFEFNNFITGKIITSGVTGKAPSINALQFLLFSCLILVIFIILIIIIKLGQISSRLEKSDKSFS